MKDKNHPILARSIAWLTLSYGLFIISNYGLHVFLARYLGVEKYGQFGLVMSIVAVVSTFLYKAISETEAKIISASPDKRYAVLSASMRIQLIMSGIATVIIIAGSKVIADLLHTPSLQTPIILCSLSIIPFSIFGAYIGVVMGLRKFGVVSIVMVVNALSKIVLMAGFILAGFGITGAFAGYSLSIVPGLIVAIVAIGIGKSFERYNTIHLIKLLTPLSLINLIYILFHSIDLFFVQHLLNDALKTGVYTSAQTIAKILPMLFVSFSNTILPSISMSLERDDIDQFRLYSRQIMRYLFIIISPIIAIVAAFAEKICVFIFSNGYKDAGIPLPILMISMGLLTILSVLLAIVIGSGKGWIACKLLSVTLVVIIVLDFNLIPLYQLNGAAWASVFGFLFGCILFYIYITKKWGNFIQVFPTVAGLAIAFLFYQIACNIPVSNNSFIIVGMVLFFAYFCILYISGVLNKEDVKVVQNIFRRKS